MPPHHHPFLRGITSAFLDAAGKVDVSREQLMIFVSGPRMTGRQSLIMRAWTLSGQRELFKAA